jgi:hypothetical protein
MVTRSVLRYVTYRIRSDDSALPEHEAVCVTGDAEDCGAKSPRCGDLDELAAWVLGHTKESGHTRFRRALHDYMRVVPADGTPCRVVPSGSGSR